LGDLSGGEFIRLMTAMTAWVSPQESCIYCHNPANFAEDSKYTKIVARKMIQMTRQINSEYKNHVAETGVTCYTCHRGNPVPAQVWFTLPDQNKGADFIGDLAGQNTPGKLVNLSSLPTDPLTPYLLEDKPIRVNGATALPTDNRQSTKQAEWTYGLMTHMSNSLGVNCTYCHNSRSFSSWENSPPQRVTAYYGIRMARDLNNAYMQPLTDTFPDNRKGAKGDVAKISCATCHQGAYKPLYGYSMLKNHPELAGKP
jgi:photosynthetic reaction center cytochrome c subunit